ncbi:MAG: ABC transporter permease [Bacteroidota bacterium]
MLNFILRRLGYGLGVMTLVLITISSIVYLAPVDPARLTFGQNVDAATVASKKEALGLDKPLIVQMFYYLNDISPLSVHKHSAENKAKYNYLKLVSTGNQEAVVLKWPFLRESFQTGRSVSEILKEKVPLTAILATAAILIGLFFGITLGVIAALKQYSWFDNSAVVTSVLGYSLPSYVTAIIIAIIFGYYLAPYTGLNLQGGLVELDDFGNKIFVWKNLILPAIALGIRPVALITQLTRSAMLDVMSQDYIRTAKAKGLSQFTIIFKHALRNALNPVLTAASGWFAALLAGAFFVENVFNYNGLGLETVNALITFDLPVVLGAVLFTAMVFVLINILIDILYAVLDPRVTVGH